MSCVSSKLLIVGSGGFGHLVKDIAEQCGYEDIAFLDDNGDIAIGKVAEYEKFTSYENIIIAIGNPEIRKKITEMVKPSFKLVSVIHPCSYISKYAKVGSGCVIEAGAVINTNAKVCDSVFVNAGAVVNHDAIVEEYSQIDCNAVVGSGRHVPSMTKVDSCMFYV